MLVISTFQGRKHEKVKESVMQDREEQQGLVAADQICDN